MPKFKLNALNLDRVSPETDLFNDLIAESTKPQFKIIEDALNKLEKQTNDKLSVKATQKALDEMWKSCQAAFSSKSCNLLIVELQNRLDLLMSREEALDVLDSIQKQMTEFVSKEQFDVINKIVAQHDFGQIRETVKTVHANSSELDTLRIYEVSGELTSAQILALNATPQPCLGSPGAGKFINVITLQLFYDYNSTPYTVAANEDLSLEYITGENILTAEMTGVLDQSADKKKHYGEGEHEVIEDEGLQFKMLNGEVTLGDSPLKYKVRYRILDALA